MKFINDLPEFFTDDVTKLFADNITLILDENSVFNRFLKAYF